MGSGVIDLNVSINRTSLTDRTLNLGMWIRVGPRACLKRKTFCNCRKLSPGHSASGVTKQTQPSQIYEELCLNNEQLDDTEGKCIVTVNTQSDCDEMCC